MAANSSSSSGNFASALITLGPDLKLKGEENWESWKPAIIRALENTKLAYFIEAGAEDNIPKKVSKYDTSATEDKVNRWLD